MSSLLIAGMSLLCAFGGVVCGMLLRRLVPEPHLDTDSIEGIKLGTGIIATMAALVLGLLIGGAKSSFDSHSASLQQLASNLAYLDRTLAHYGPDAAAARAHLREMIPLIIDRIWPRDGVQQFDAPNAAIADRSRAMFDAIRALRPADEAQQDARDHALQMNSDMTRARWQITHRDYDTLPFPFLIVLLFWFFVLFASLGAFWTRNATVVAVFFICSLSVASAMFLIVDLDQPFEGVIQVSQGTLVDLLSQLGK